MTTINLLSPDRAQAHLIAGRKAAYAELVATSSRLGVNIAGETPEVYQGGPITINGVLDLVPMVDAATLETMVRVRLPDVAVPARRKFVDWPVMLREFAVPVLAVMLSTLAFSAWLQAMLYIWTR